MTDETKVADAPAEATATSVEDAALAKAIENGYRAPSPPSREERIGALINSYAAGLDHNSPRTESEFAEMKALLLGDA